MTDLFLLFIQASDTRVWLFLSCAYLIAIKIIVGFVCSQLNV